MGTVNFESLKVLESSNYYTGSFSIYEATYDMGSVHSHKLRITFRDRLRVPLTWIVSLLVGFLFALPLAVLISIFFLGHHPPPERVPVFLFLSIPVSVAWGYYLSTFYVPRQWMHELALRDRGSTTNEKLAIVKQENWAKFVSRLKGREQIRRQRQRLGL